MAKRLFYELLLVLPNQQQAMCSSTIKKINAVPANERQVNTVFQDYALFPHLNVFENVAFGLRIKKAT